MRFSTILAVFPAFTVAFGAVVFSHPEPLSYVAVNVVDNGRTSVGEDAPNGLYTYHNGTHAAYHGEVAPATEEGLAAASRRAVSVPCDVSCNGQQGNINDIQAAQAGLEGFFGSGLCWSKQIFYRVNSVYAFGCDYGNGQCQSSDGFKAEIACVDSKCGTTQGGWNSVHSAKVSHGREYGSFGC